MPRKRRRSSGSTCRSACRSGSSAPAARPTGRRARCSGPPAPASSPSRRAAVEAAGYEDGKRLARAHSDPPHAFSIQCFNILPYIREVDALLRGRPELRTRVHEVHPEVAFFRLNRDRPLGAGKKRPAGLDERRALLARAGLPEALVHAKPPPGIGREDHLDAMAALVVARDIALGRAVSLPERPEHDAYGLPVAIWAPAPPDDARDALS